MSQEQDQPIRGRIATPDEVAWQEFHRKSRQETPKRIEDAAKYLSGIVSVVFAIYNAAHKGEPQSAIPHLASVLLLISLAASLVVIFPLRRRVAAASAASIQKELRSAIRWKYWLLVVSALFLLAGTAAMLF
jgi:Na+/melibiose symporter-like transporter